MPTERFDRDVYCRDLKLTSRFLAFKPFKLPSYCPSIQLDISYLATFIIPLCPEKSYLIFQNICVRKENHVCSRNCSGICEKAIFNGRNCTRAPMAILTTLAQKLAPVDCETYQQQILMPHFGGLHYAGRTTLSDLRYNPPKVDGKVSLKHIFWKRGRNELLVWRTSSCMYLFERSMFWRILCSQVVSLVDVGTYSLQCMTDKCGT